MEESLISESINWFQAFIMALYSATVLLLGLGVLASMYNSVISTYNALASGIALYLAWSAFGLLMIGVLSIVIMGFSVGFSKYNVALAGLGLGFLFSGLSNILYLSALYLAGVISIDNTFYIEIIGSVLEILVAGLAIKFSKNLEEEPRFTSLVALILTVPLINGLTVFFTPNYTAADVFEMIGDYVYSVVSYSARDIIYLALGGYLAPLAIVAILLSLTLAGRAGDFQSSFGAKLSLTFGVFAGILGLLFSSIGGAIETAKQLIVYNTNAELIVLNHYFEALSIVTFFGLMALAFLGLSRYRVVTTAPRRRERPVEETIEEVTVSAEERRKEGEEIIEGLEELEFDEFEDLDEL